MQRQADGDIPDIVEFLTDEWAVEEKFPKENFRVNREMRDEILVYESILSKFWAKMASKCRENASENWILRFRF